MGRGLYPRSRVSLGQIDPTADPTGPICHGGAACVRSDVGNLGGEDRASYSLRYFAP
jgi:hypothetical protein